MTQCLYCNVETNNPKFCSSSCAAKHNNQIYPKRRKIQRFCKVCGVPIPQRRTVCDEHAKQQPVDWATVQIKSTPTVIRDADNMHSKTKGTLAEMKIVADLYSKGFSVAKPLDDLTPIDIIVIDLNNYSLNKIQVKYSNIENNCIKLYLRNSMSNRNMLYTKVYTQEEVDVFGIYVQDIDKCLYINSSILDTHKSSLHIRTVKPKTTNGKISYFIDDYINYPPLI
jgi:Protein of unknown function (DUF3257).